MVQPELGKLRQELFTYWDNHPTTTESSLRDAGFGEQLDTLYGGRWNRADDDFKFYQFVITAQKYLSAKTPQEMKRLERRLAKVALYFGLSEEDKLLVAAGEKEITPEQQQELLGGLSLYILERPPIYAEAYKNGLIRALLMERSPEVLSIEAHPKEVERSLMDQSDYSMRTATDRPSFMLLPEQVEQILLPLTEKERAVLTLRFGLKDGRSRTLQETSRVLGYKSRETARRIEAKALRKMIHRPISSKLRDFLE